MTLKQGLCPACGSTEVFSKPGGVRGYGRALDIQTGIIPLADGAGYVDLDGYVCSGCGHTEIGVPAAKLDQLRRAIGARGWKRVERG
jgi:hypothetical protein